MPGSEVALATGWTTSCNTHNNILYFEKNSWSSLIHSGRRNFSTIKNCCCVETIYFSLIYPSIEKAKHTNN